MTLVVARKTQLGVRLAADMRLTDRSATQHGFLNARLKLVLVSPGQCIAYAGADSLALDTVRRVANAGLAPTDAACDLLEAHLKSAGEVEFLLASLDPCQLIAIKDGRRELCEASWLGDVDAFGEYQEHYHAAQYLPPAETFDSRAEADDMEVAARMGSGMAAAIHGPALDASGQPVIPAGGQHATVGEAIVYAHRRVPHRKFGYAYCTHARASPFAERSESQTGVIPPDFGSAEKGAFSYFFLAPIEPGIAAVGIYFAEGRLGALYAPLVDDGPQTYRRLSLAAFVRRVAAEHRITLEGFGLANEW